MATQVQRRRGTTAEHASFAGAVGEVTINTTKETAVIHDGATNGGFELARADLDNVSNITNAKLANSSVTITAGSGLGGGGSVALGASVEITADVITVHGRAGVVISAANDYNATQIQNSATGTISATNVQAAINELDGEKLALAGGTMTGDLVLAGDPDAALKAATKQYVDGLVQGLDTKNSVRAATTTAGGNITLSGTQTIDTVSLVVDDRVLVKNQTDLTENGLYDVASGAWSRSADADNTPGGELGPGMFTFVEEGSDNSDNGFVAFGTATGAGSLEGFFSLGVDDIEFAQFSGAGGITAGTNLNKDGNVINVDAVMSNFASTGINDDATSIAITINSSENVGIGASAGATSPDAKLVVADSAALEARVLHQGNGTTVLRRDGTISYLLSESTTAANRKLVFGTQPSAGGAITENMRIDENGNVGIGISTPDGSLHVHTATAGTVDANTSANDLILENSASGGMSILTPNTVAGNIYFGDPEDNRAGQISYNHSNNVMSITTNSTAAMHINSSGNIGIGIFGPDGRLHVHTATAGAVTAAAAADDFIVENSADVGMSLMCPATDVGSIYFADPNDNGPGQIRYDHATDEMIFRTGTVDRMSVGDPSADGTLHVLTASAGAATAAGPADDLVVENNSDAGISILSPAANTGSIFFGDPNDTDIGQLVYDHSDNSMAFTANASERVRITSAGQLGVGTTSPDGRVHAFAATAGTVDAHGDANEFIAENNTHGGLSILTPNTTRGSIYFGDPDDNDVGKIVYDHNINALGLFVNGSEIMTISSAGNVGIGDTTPTDGKFQVNNSSSSIASFINNTGTGIGFFISNGSTAGASADIRQASVTQPATVFSASAALYTGLMLRLDSTRALNSSFSYMTCRSEGGGGPNGFTFRGDGNGFAAGSFSGGGADYADYFEWADGNPNNEDRIGYSVVTNDDRKIELAYLHPEKEPVGVISGNPAATGNSAWNGWDNQFLRDDFERYILDASGDRISNPDYDPDREYTPRDERPEWDAVGLVGRLPLRSGQPVADSWIKLGNISAEVEEWLVK